MSGEAAIDGYGYGYGDGDGDGSGYGDGDGDGDGSGYGDGDGSGDGYGSGYGDGDGDGSGYGSGYGDGSGYGEVIGAVGEWRALRVWPGVVRIGCQVHTTAAWREIWNDLAEQHEVDIDGQEVARLLAAAEAL